MLSLNEDYDVVLIAVLRFMTTILVTSIILQKSHCTKYTTKIDTKYLICVEIDLLIGYRTCTLRRLNE